MHLRFGFDMSQLPTGQARAADPSRQTTVCDENQLVRDAWRIYAHLQENRPNRTSFETRVTALTSPQVVRYEEIPFERL
jgi:hypothetical protein